MCTTGIRVCAVLLALTAVIATPTRPQSARADRQDFGRFDADRSAPITRVLPVRSPIGREAQVGH